MREEDIAMAKAIYAENKDSPAPLRRNMQSDERAKAFRWERKFIHKFECPWTWMLFPA